jgi:uncharacterized protein DUF5999
MTQFSTWFAQLAGSGGTRDPSVRQPSARRSARCPHRPPCPTAKDHDRTAARVVSGHPEQGWSLLCNGVIVFDDTGELLPDGHAVAAHRPGALVAV